MSKQAVVNLFRAAQSNPQLKTQLNTASDVEAFVQLAAKQGFEFTSDEWRQTVGFSVEELECELSEIPGI
ncbi:MAG: Nif11-like leader peptide family natural product precursor [Stenomitos rutilans HA7619-LM2]|jgi:predicted ribosomally synthesized peptide with nif11-like leader|nr:Nif11-like leader peptide family natural product precursor [Stenomitos rutilans HA7619-LM2]